MGGSSQQNSKRVMYEGKVSTVVFLFNYPVDFVHSM